MLIITKITIIKYDFSVKKIKWVVMSQNISLMIFSEINVNRVFFPIND